MVNLKSSQKLRFALVGIANTTIDFTIFFSLSSIGIPALAANITSTSTAFCFSFFANKNYTFKSNSGNLKRELPLFIAVTLFGLWVLQNLVIYLVTSALTPLGLPLSLILVIAKLSAVVISLIWNYLMYSHVVFIDKVSNDR